VPEASLRGVRHIVVLADEVPGSALPGLISCEELIGGEREAYPPKPDEARKDDRRAVPAGNLGRRPARVRAGLWKAP
jgi:hypothetical protein